MACSLHADRQLVGQSGRALLRRHHRKVDPPRRRLLDRRIGSRDPSLHRRRQLRPKALPLDQNPPTISSPPIKRLCLKTLEITSTQAKIAQTSETGHQAVWTKLRPMMFLGFPCESAMILYAPTESQGRGRCRQAWMMTIGRTRLPCLRLPAASREEGSRAIAASLRCCGG